MTVETREREMMDNLEVLERLEARMREKLATSEVARPNLERALAKIVQRIDAAVKLRYWEG